jgi:hypothetical protein
MKKTLLSILAIIALSVCSSAQQTLQADKLTINSNVAAQNVTMLDSNGDSGVGQAGNGMYIFEGSRSDTGCVTFYISGDGKNVRPLYYPVTEPQCSDASQGTLSYGVLFRAPWNNTYYYAYTSFTTSSSTSSNGNVLWLTSSPTLLQNSWSAVTNFTVSSNTALWQMYPTQWFMDNATVCPAQDYTCTHLIIGMDSVHATMGGNASQYELHPTNSAMTSWSSPSVISSAPLSNGNDWFLYYNGAYYLYSLNSALWRVPITYPSTGTLIANETVVQASTGATGVVVQPCCASYTPDVPYLDLVAAPTGSPDGTHAWVGQTSGAAVTPTGVPVALSYPGASSNNINNGMAYSIYTSSSLTGTYSFVCRMLGGQLIPTGTITQASGEVDFLGVEGISVVQSDSGTWRAYYHNSSSPQGGYLWAENTNPASCTGWGSGTAMLSTNMHALDYMQVIRTSDMRSAYMAAGEARQDSIPWKTNRGILASDNSGGYGNGTFGKHYYGIEHVGLNQNADGTDEVRLFADPVPEGVGSLPSGRIVFGNYNKVIPLMAVYATSSTATYIIKRTWVGQITPLVGDVVSISGFQLANYQFNGGALTVASIPSYVSCPSPYNTAGDACFTVSGTYTAQGVTLDNGEADEFTNWAYFDKTGLHSSALNTTLTKTCVFQFGDDSASSALATVQIYPQKSICPVDVAGKVFQVVVMGDAGASSVKVGYRHNNTLTSFSPSCTNTLGTVSGINDVISVSGGYGWGSSGTVEGVTVSANCGITNYTLTAGDWIETTAGTADGTTKRMTVAVTWQYTN